MYKSYFLFSVILFSLSQFSYAKGVVDCRVISNSSTTKCNPFSSKLIKAKEISYDVDRKKLIISKTLPLAEKKTIKVVSVEDMIEKYVHIEAPIRFYGAPKKFTTKHEKELPSKVISEKDHTHKSSTLNSKKESITKVLLPEKAEVSEKKNESVDYGIYKVVRGDIVGRIASKFEMTTEELLSLNHLDKNATLKIGQKFKIPLSQKMVDSIVNAEYVIEPGDTLLSIAHRFNLDPKLLVKFNHLKSSAMIREGKTLALPLSHIVKKLETNKKIELAKKKKEEEEKKKLALIKKKKEKIKKKSSRIKAHISQRKLYVKGIGRHKLRVTATAYSSHRRQTDSTPFLAAWNNRLHPGMKIIAVSRDLLTRYGLRNGTKVRIAGLQGYYRVRDKMNKRFRKRIDIYMGVNRRRALRWGRRSVNIYW